MDRALDDLNTAIEARLAKENEFINQITAEFRRISADMQRTASANPRLEPDLQPYIERIDEAADLLNSRPSLGLRSNVAELVQQIRGGPPPGPGGGPAGGPAGDGTGSSGSGSSGSSGSGSSGSSGLFSGLTSMFSRRPPPSAPPRPDDDYQDAEDGGIDLDGAIEPRDDEVTATGNLSDSVISNYRPGAAVGGKRKRGGWTIRRSIRRPTKRYTRRPTRRPKHF